MQWLWIVAIVLLLAGLLLFFPLVHYRQSHPGKKDDAGSKKKASGAGPKRSKSASREADTTETNPSKGTISSAQRFNEKERDEMLDGVRNLARDNPKKVASMVRHWMKE